MRNSFWYCALFILALSFVACSRKSNPSSSSGNKNVNARIVYPDKNGNYNNGTIVPGVPDSIATVSPSNERVLIILDKGGRLTVNQKTVPSYVLASNKVLPINQPLTAAERNNLLARQKTLLPLALYVPQGMGAVSGKGEYYKYRGKYWYWKKKDGFYYLDEVYYK